jgi:hypothetical protein
VDADHPGPEERRGIEDAAIDVRLGGEVDDRVGVSHERSDEVPIGNVALDEAEPHRQLRVGLDRGEVGPVAGVGQLVDDGDPGAIAPRQHVSHEA